jgi:hypothetical protein
MFTIYDPIYIVNDENGSPSKLGENTPAKSPILKFNYEHNTIDKFDLNSEDE